MVVVLPAPFGPRKACTSPDLTARSRPSSAVVRPNVLRSARTSIAFVMRASLHNFHDVLNIKNTVC